MSIGFWSEGDPLSPTNLNSRGGGNFPFKLYHVAWALGSGTTQINNAIVNAKANGYTGVYVDATRLPYAAASVTFDPTIHMFREGGSFRKDEYEPEAYGATADGITDDWAALTACGLAATAVHGTVKLGKGLLNLSRPWVVQTDLQVIGLPTRGGFSATNWPSAIQAVGGPTLVMSGVNTFGPLSSALVGTGNCFGNGASSVAKFIDLRDIPSGELNGLDQFCYEFFFKTTNVGGASYYLGGSGGTDFALIGHNCWRLQLNSDGTITGKLNVAGSVKTITGGSISANTVYWVALTYDGSTVRLFYGQPGGTSTLIGTAAASGTLTMDPSEIIVPFDMDPSFALSGLPGYWDSIRLTRHTARYTTTGPVPNAKLSSDVNTVIVLNFDLQDGILTRGQGVDGDSWFWLRAAANVGQRAHIENVGFPGAGSGIVLVAGQGSMLRTCAFGGRDAIQVSGSNFAVQIDHPYISPTRRGITLGTLIGGDAGVCTIINPIYQNGCGRFGIEAQDSSFVVVGGYFVTGSTTVAHVVLHGDSPATLLGTVLSFENFSSACQTIIHNGGSNIAYFGGRIETQNSVPFVTASSPNAKLTFSGTEFDVIGNISQAPSSIVTVVSGKNPTLPFEFIGCSQNAGTWVPWSNVTGSSSVGRIGTLFSSSTGSTLKFDASIADEWDLTLTSDVTLSNWTNINYGQPVSGAIKMDSTGSRLFTWPTNSKGTVALSVGSAAINTFAGFYDGVNVILTSVRTGL